MPAACSLSSAVAKSGTCSNPCSIVLLAVPGAARPLTACWGLSSTCTQTRSCPQGSSLTRDVQGSATLQQAAYSSLFQQTLHQGLNTYIQR